MDRQVQYRAYSEQQQQPSELNMTAFAVGGGHGMTGYSNGGGIGGIGGSRGNSTDGSETGDSGTSRNDTNDTIERQDDDRGQQQPKQVTFTPYDWWFYYQDDEVTVRREKRRHPLTSSAQWREKQRTSRRLRKSQTISRISPSRRQKTKHPHEDARRQRQ